MHRGPVMGTIFLDSEEHFADGEHERGGNMVTRILLLPAVLGWFILSAAAPRFTAAQSSSGRPNVVLIMTDNHGAWTLGCYGNPDIRTPNIDRLADEGVLFTRAFASNPVCSPTRATFLTGLIPSQHGVHSFLSGGRLQVGPSARCTLDDFTSLPEVLREEGYACGLVGKWHLGDNLRPQEGLDDYWITMPHGGTSTFYDAPVIEDGKIRKEPKYLTDLWTEHALKFIQQQAGEEEPFFLFLAYNGPYSLGRLLLRDARNRHADYYADKELASFPRQTPHPWQQNNRDYINNPTSIRRVASEVSGVDDGVGEVMSALQRHGLDDNTIVIFVADQGWVGGHGGFFGMGDHTRPLTARDGMMLIPTIWRHPGHIQAGVRSDRMVSNYDFMPTLLSHLGLKDRMPTSPRSPGVDYSPVLSGKGGDSVEPDAVFYEFENLRCIRTADHKYVHRHPNGPHELYDLKKDPDELVNLVGDAGHRPLQDRLRRRLDSFYDEFALPKYDMWKGGTSQVRIHDGIDEEIAQLAPVQPPPVTAGFQPAEIKLPDGFTAELAAAPPLVTHPTMACFDDRGRLYVCNNAGVNMTNQDLEKNLPNAIHRLTDRDQDGRFDHATVFADKMTFPMGGTWHDGALYVASPPNIWRLRDTDDDGVADDRQVIVNQFGYNGNAASIHGCFSGPDGRIYWTDGYHGHEFKDADGKVTSQREGSYLFSCRADGSDRRIHCGGGMDNPVEIDFTDSGDMLGTVNILYTRPRVDALVHWLYGGAYPHRERVLQEIQVTGDLLGPAHRFGHVAVSGMTRYRSGAMDHRWGNNLFVSFFNRGNIVRLETKRQGSTYSVTQHEFLSSPSRDFHPTDVLEDADGSLLVIDTGGWFYRGCPTSQFSKPELLGGIYRIRRKGMTTLVDPRGNRIDWAAQSATSLVRQMNDTRFVVRQAAVAEAAGRGEAMIPTLGSMIRRGDIRVRQNCVWALTRMVQDEQLAPAAADALAAALADPDAAIRQSACHGLSESLSAIDLSLIRPLLDDEDAATRRTAAMTLGRIGDSKAVPALLAAAANSHADRSEQHAITYALIEIGDVDAIRQAILATDSTSVNRAQTAMMAIDQIDADRLKPDDVFAGLLSKEPAYRRAAHRIIKRRPQWAGEVSHLLDDVIESGIEENSELVLMLLSTFIADRRIAKRTGGLLQPNASKTHRSIALRAIAQANSVPLHSSWKEPLLQLLSDSDQQNIIPSIAAVASIQGNDFAGPLKTISTDASLPMNVRLSSLAAVTQRATLDEEIFALLIDLCRGSDSPHAAGRAAQIIAAAKLTDPQLVEVSKVLAKATPSQLRTLLSCFAGTRKPPVIRAFLTAIGSAESFLTLGEHELSDIVKRYPPETLDRANELLDQLRAHHQQKRLKLERLRDQVQRGDVDAGRKVFHSEKAKCSTCHKVGDSGTRVGPDLTTIGSNRSTDDLLESIVFPSASVVRDYESYKVLTLDGRAITGLLVKENAEVFVVQQASGEKVTILRDDVDAMVPSSVSIMPSGLDEALTESQLADVVSYLQSLQEKRP